MLNLKVSGSLPTGIPDFTEAFSKARDIMYTSVMENFSTGGRPVKWFGLKTGAPSYLFLTGRLKTAIRKVSDSSSATVGVSTSQVPYALIHQFGGTAGRGAYIRPRPYMMFQDEDKAEIVNMFGSTVITFYQTPKGQQKV